MTALRRCVGQCARVERERQKHNTTTLLASPAPLLNQPLHPSLPSSQFVDGDADADADLGPDGERIDIMAVDGEDGGGAGGANAAGGGPARERVTTRYMTKYERARVLGTRALQISMNAPVMVELAGESDPLDIATKELRERKIPFIIRRFLPDGSYEDWSVAELIPTDR